jgi:hypothetical protein
MGENINSASLVSGMEERDIQPQALMNSLHGDETFKTLLSREFSHLRKTETPPWSRDPLMARILSWFASRPVMQHDRRNRQGQDNGSISEEESREKSFGLIWYNC